MGKRFYEEGVSTNENFSQEDFAEMVKDAALDTAVNTVNLISVLEPKAIEAEEVQAISDATGSTPDYVAGVVDATSQATEAFSEAKNDEEIQFVSQSFSDLVDEITEANFSELQNSVINFSQNFSEDFDAEKVVENVVKIAGAIDPKAIENLGKDKVVEVISEATKVPEETTEEIVEAVTGCDDEACEDAGEDAGEQADYSDAEDYQEDFAETTAKRFGKINQVWNKVKEGARKYAGVAKEKYVGANYQVWNKAAGTKVGKKVISPSLAYGPKMTKFIKYGTIPTAAAVTSAAAYGAYKGAQKVFGNKKNYSDVVLYTEDGIPVHFDNLEVEVDQQSMPEMPNPNPVANNGGLLTPVTPEDAATNPVVQQTPADAAQDPKVGMAPSDDASQALAAAAMKQDLVTAKTVAGTEPATVNASSQFSILDGIVESIEDGSLK
jgi:hypothetical protein